MKASVVKVTPADFPRVHESLLHSLNPHIPADRWLRLFDWGWANPEDHVGFALETPDGNLVGFIATLYSLQSIGTSVVPVCNLSSWIVEPGFRSSALSLVMPVLRRPEITVTNLTSLPEVNDMFRKLGFRTLETHTRVIFPLPRPGLPRRVACTQVDPDSLVGHHDQEILMRLRDHRYAEQQWMLQHDGSSCHVILTMGRRRRLRTARIHHLDHPAVFAAGVRTLHRRLFQEYGAVLMECDDRLLSGLRIPGTRRIPLPVTRIFRSRDVEAAQLSNFYSELPLLNL